jgi:hypothetical protein
MIWKVAGQILGNDSFSLYLTETVNLLPPTSPFFSPFLMSPKMLLFPFLTLHFFSFLFIFKYYKHTVFAGKIK